MRSYSWNDLDELFSGWVIDTLSITVTDEQDPLMSLDTPSNNLISVLITTPQCFSSLPPTINTWFSPSTTTEDYFKIGPSLWSSFDSFEVCTAFWPVLPLFHISQKIREREKHLLIWDVESSVGTFQIGLVLFCNIL